PVSTVSRTVSAMGNSLLKAYPPGKAACSLQLSAAGSVPGVVAAGTAGMHADDGLAGLRDVEAFGQIVGETQVLLVRAFAHLLVPGRAERSQGRSLVAAAESMVGQREEAVVLLEDVFTQQVSIGPCVVGEANDCLVSLCGGAFDHRLHRLDMPAAFVMLPQHH